MLEIDDTLEHEKLEGRFRVASKEPVVLTRNMKLTQLEGWYVKGPHGAYLSIDSMKRGSILGSSQHQGEFVVTLIMRGAVFVTEMRPVTDPKGWWVKEWFQ